MFFEIPLFFDSPCTHMTNRSEIGQLRQKVSSYKGKAKKWQKRARALSKQVDVMKKFITDTRTRPQVKMRSVGLQVMTADRCGSSTITKSTHPVAKTSMALGKGDEDSPVEKVPVSRQLPTRSDQQTAVTTTVNINNNNNHKQNPNYRCGKCDFKNDFISDFKKHQCVGNKKEQEHGDNNKVINSFDNIDHFGTIKNIYEGEETRGEKEVKRKGWLQVLGLTELPQHRAGR